jgi:hypothetical protein
MPIQSGLDKIGNYLRWGNKGKKYYYYDKKTFNESKEKAAKQGIAINIRKREYF